MHPTHVLAYAPVDTYANQHQSAAMYVALLFIALLVIAVIRMFSRTAS